MTRLAILTAALALAACAAPQPTIEAAPLYTFKREQYAYGTCPVGQRVAINDHRPQGGPIEIACREGR